MTRLRVGLAALVAVIAAVAFAAPASAVHGTRPFYDPQTTNVPYLAWRGEELRLVKCSDDINTDAPGEGQSVDWIVEDWSGYPFQPPALEASTVKFFVGTGEHDDQGCVKADFVSLKAGLAMIKLVVSDDDTGNPILKHQFLVGWLSLNAPVCREVSATSQPGGGGALGDPPGDGVFDPGEGPGRVQCDVSGELPLGNNFTELGLPGSITLPAETPFTNLDDPDDTYWDDLAAALATTSSALPLYRDAPWRMWDIHDDRARSEGHVNPALCRVAGSAHTALDAVDDCGSAVAESIVYISSTVEPGSGLVFSGYESFTRVFGAPFGESVTPTLGPFDPLRPNMTLLSDGKLDGGDVPMPAARLDVSIAPNTGSPTDISGVGFLGGAPKCLGYTQDHVCSFGYTAPAGVHRHYAPYYGRWIPATSASSTPGINAFFGSADTEASGSDGPAVGNNYPGYGSHFANPQFNVRPGFYNYWELSQILRTAAGGNTNCLHRDPPDGPPIFRQRPSGPHSVIVYTDEHGEAQVRFFPGTGFFFDNLGVGTNLNNACDLQNVDVLGTADIRAIARYPYQKTTGADMASNTVTKTIGNLFDKSVDCVPKGPIPPITNGMAFICTATAIDITGAPFVNEKVCFMTNGEGMREYPLGVPFQVEGLHRLCVWTDNTGRARVEVFGKCSAGNVIAEFVEEGIIRFDTFTFSCPPGGAGGTSAGGTSSTGGSAVPAGVDPATITPGASTQKTQQVIQQAKADQAKAQGKPAAKPKKATLAFARIDKKPFAKQGARYVVVRVNAAARTARIQVTLIGRSGKVLGKVVRTVPTNRVVRVPKLKLPKAVKTARVKVLA